MAGSKGKSPQKAKGGSKRHKGVFRDSLKGISKPALRRLARRGGVKRVSAAVYDEVRKTVREFVESVVYYALVYKGTRGRNTVGIKDVIFALNRRGNALVGAEQHQKKKKSKK